MDGAWTGIPLKTPKIAGSQFPVRTASGAPGDGQHNPDLAAAEGEGSDAELERGGRVRTVIR